MLCRPVLGFLLLSLVSSGMEPDAQRDVMVYEQVSNQWFEGALARAVISADANWMLLMPFSGSARLVSVKAGSEDQSRMSVGLDSPAASAVFCGAEKLALRGKQGATRGWFLSTNTMAEPISVPPDSELQCSSDGKVVAYYLPSQPEKGLFVGSSGKFENYLVSGSVSAMAFARDGRTLYALSFQSDGASSLIRIIPNKLGVETIASGLDANPWPNSIAVSTDGHSLFLALASDAAPDNAMRHQPTAQRWLRIYQLDLASGTRNLVVQSRDQDNFDPMFVAGGLYWSRNVIRRSVVLLPVDGGKTKQLVANGEVPIWSPDGRRISYVFGGWRLADWAINWDAAVVDIDPRNQEASSPRIIVSGYHEDFPAAWSPNGRWIAFHSHRSKTPVATYFSPGGTDDIYIRFADDLHAPEIRVSDFGWEAGPAYWSPDGRRLIFSSWVKGGQPGICKVWVVTLDPDSGKVLRTDRLPLSPDIRSAQWAAWSPDGKKIAIEDDHGGENRSLWIADADGANAQKLVDYQGSTYGGLDWTPDGKTIIYAGLAGDRMQLFRIPAHGGSPNQLSHEPGNLMHPRVSPDGRWVACSRFTQSHQVWHRVEGEQ